MFMSFSSFIIFLLNWIFDEIDEIYILKGKVEALSQAFALSTQTTRIFTRQGTYQ